MLSLLIDPVFANSTTTSQTASSSTSTSSGSASITSAASTSLDSAAPTFTGNPDDLGDWCVTQYEAYVNASGTPTVILTTTDTGFLYDGPQSDVALSSTAWSSTVTITSTIIPPGYTSPPQCVCRHHSVVRGSTDKW
jgi:hypothetical protein